MVAVKNNILKRFALRISAYLTRPIDRPKRVSGIPSEIIRPVLQVGDVLLIEGNTRVSTAIQYLTQSTWSHACIYTGHNTEKPVLEADLVEGIREISIDYYDDFNIRICRPVNLSNEDKKKLVDFCVARIGHQYDIKNLIDLIRYVMPEPPIPRRFRRHMIALGSGDPTKAICSTFIAQAFQSIRYPILPREINECVGDHCTIDDQKLLENMHFSHFTPRDFDLSPYFEVIKPTLTNDFDYRKLRWA